MSTDVARIVADPEFRIGEVDRELYLNVVSGKR